MIPPKRSLTDLPGWYAGTNDGVNQRWKRSAKEKIRVAFISAIRNTTRIPDAPQYWATIRIALM
jgi:hypothetical protein